MSDQSKLLMENVKYDSTPERSGFHKLKIADRAGRPKTRAWGETKEDEAISHPDDNLGRDNGGVSETSFSRVPVGVEELVNEGVSPPPPTSSLPSPQHTIGLVTKGAFALSPIPLKHQNMEEAERDDRIVTGGSSSGISSVRSATPGSDSKSYRERIRERVQAAKERALAAGSSKARIPKSKSPAHIKSEEFVKDEDQVEEAMKRHKEIRSKWKVATASVHVANIQSGYDFFTKGEDWASWNRSTNTQPEPEENPLTADKSKGESSDDEGEKVMIGDLLGSPDTDWLSPVTYQAPQPTHSNKIKEKQIGLFFCPSTSPVPIEEKLEADMPPRFIEDEGLYIGKTSNIPFKSRNKMEQRIMAMGSERFWFGEDGELKGNGDPLEYSSFNIYLGDDTQPLIEYIPAEKDKSGGLAGSGDDVYLLEIELGRLTFRHHPLFTKEHCIGERLRELCQPTNSPQSRLGGRLEALRSSRDHLLKLYAISGDDIHLSRAIKQISEIKCVRTEWLSEKKQERERISNILETWRDLKHIRDKQGFVSSKHKLRILTTEESDHDWDAQLKAYLDEVTEETEEDFKIKSKQYYEKISKWKKRKEKKDEGVSSEDDIDSWSEDEIEEPVKPVKTSKSQLRQAVEEELAACLRPPSEPAIQVQLLETAEISVTSGNPMEEERRKVLSQCRTAVVLEVNGKQVDKTTGSQLNEMFECELNERFCLKLESQPQSLSLKIVEVGHTALFGKKPIALIFIPIPGRIHREAADLCEYEYSCGERVGPLKHTGVGCGQLDLESQSNSGVKILYTTGVLSVRAGWAEPLPNILHQTKPTKINSKPSQTNMEKLKMWVEQVQLDPNDPNNADLFEFLKAGECKSNETDSGVIEFCSEEEILENPRLKLLMLREAGQPEFRHMRLIPLNLREIPKDIFKLYEKRIGGRKKKLRDGRLEQERAWAKEYIEQVKEDVLKKSRFHQVKTFRDIVHEEPVPDLGTLGLTLMKWLQPKRPLRPRRKQRKKFPVKSLLGQQVEIIVNIGRAFEVPVRKEVDDKSSEVGFSVVPVRPFIEVTFEGERRRTNTAEGPNPTWNQDLHIPIQNLHGDFNPAALQSLKESIHIHLYDEKLVDIIDDDRLRETNIHQRMERHWLASLRIPFPALVSNYRIEGTFEMYSPPVLLGYERESKEFRDSTFLTVFLIVHPPLHPPSPLQEKVESHEELYLEEHLEQWSKQIQNVFPNRHVPTLVIDSSGKSVCITRFFKPITPPELCEDVRTTPAMAARFVSMIPVIPGNMLYPGYLDIWLTANEVITLGVCESCSSAALLCCFMRALELQSWLLVGCGLSSGPALYVLTKSPEGQLTLWDPSTGRSYLTSHPFSPLYRVYALIDDSNIWVNNQKDDLFSCCNLDVTKRYDWWPAFGRSVAAPNNSLQDNSLLYKPSQDVKQLEGRLEKLLRNAIMKLRPTHRTVWNRYCGACLKKLLPGLEKGAWSGEHSSPPDHLNELQHVLSSYKMCGFPINLPYSSPAQLVDAVKSTGVHINDAPDIEFSLAVYIYPFPNNILSVWIYVASLERRR